MVNGFLKRELGGARLHASESASWEALEAVQRRNETAIATVVIGKQHVALVEFLDSREEISQERRRVEIGRLAARQAVGLRQAGPTEPVAALAEVEQEQVAWLLDALQLWRQVLHRIRNGCECRYDQGNRCDDVVLVAVRLEARAHR